MLLTGPREPVLPFTVQLDLLHGPPGTPGVEARRLRRSPRRHGGGGFSNCHRGMVRR